MGRHGKGLVRGADAGAEGYAVTGVFGNFARALCVLRGGAFAPSRSTHDDRAGNNLHHVPATPLESRKIDLTSDR
jgi:hypothetical protein